MTKRKTQETPDDVLDVMIRNRKADSGTLYNELRRGADPVTPVSEIRRMMKKYSKKYNVPIRMSAAAVEDAFFDGEAMYSYHYNRYGKVVGIIYLHPVLQFYPRDHVEKVIEHELDHFHVEQRWEDVL